MARARSIQCGDETAGVRVEYVKTRRVVRLGGWHSRDRDIRPLEVPAARFFDDLGIAPEEIGAALTYLVLASVWDRSTRTLRYQAAAFPSELQARQLFLRLRAEHQGADEWAQVVSLDGRCRMTPLCWFGVPGELNAGRFETTTGRALGPVGRVDDGNEEDAGSLRSRRWANRRTRA